MGSQNKKVRDALADKSCAMALKTFQSGHVSRSVKFASEAQALFL